jgi:protoporphyrinogen oxidase
MNAIIIGAGPAGLTAAYELLTRTSIKPIILEASPRLGGLAQTIEHHGNRMDMGGHRFFSKSDRVMEWWFKFLPLQALAHPEETIAYQGRARTVAAPGPAPDPAREDRVMLLRQRCSRIYYLRKLFRYPLELSFETLANVGFFRSIVILLSYLRAVVFPPRHVENLEDFFISRFGRELYSIFFKSYTEKVWGVPCREMSAKWGAQRVKSLSIARAIGHALRSSLSLGPPKQVETSLIDQFLYPKYGPGQMWETVAREIEARGGVIHRDARALRFEMDGTKVVSVTAGSADGTRSQVYRGDYFFSTMPVKELVRALDPAPPAGIREISEGLVYRDFVTVGLLLEKLEIGAVGESGTVRDNWIYIHDPNVEAGRLQIFNNWSPWLVKDAGKVWIGVEYFCDEGDRIWSRSDAEMALHTMKDLRAMGLVGEEAPLDSVVVRMKKAYPAYQGTYSRFGELRSHLDSVENLYLIGRNGMHRYNNQDHSMLAAMVAVDNLIEGRTDRANLWDVNSEEDYHEEKSGKSPAGDR